MSFGLVMDIILLYLFFYPVETIVFVDHFKLELSASCPLLIFIFTGGIVYILLFICQRFWFFKTRVDKFFKIKHVYTSTCTGFYNIITIFKDSPTHYCIKLIIYFFSGDYLRIWRAGEPDTRLECVLNNNKNSDFCAPLTSFDWNEVDQNLVGTSSIDTTCTIWGLETGQVSLI